MLLKDLKPNKSAIIMNVGGTGALRQHFLDMGIIPGAKITSVKAAPMGDPLEFRIHGYELTLRLNEANEIQVNPVNESHYESSSNDKRKNIEHPGLGEEGKYHDKNSTPLPDNTILRFALVGNQNSGKTTLFNRLTGSNQHVGNFPGVTMDRKSGVIKNFPYTDVTDLPGIYSMSPYSSEEIISRDFVLNEKPHAIINIVDANNIERNLYLTMQLLEMEIPMVIALNMMDEVSDNGGSIDINAMEEILGVPVVPISAAKNEGIEELITHAIHIAHYQELPKRQDFCDEKEHNGALHRCIHAIIHLIKDHAERAKIPVRFAAGKLVENDSLIIKELKLEQNELEMIEHIVLQMESERELDRNAAMADMRYSFIQKVCDYTVIKPEKNKGFLKSQKLDRLLTGKYTAIPIFILIMGVIFWLTFNVIGAWLQELLEEGIGYLSEITDTTLTSLKVNQVLHGLIIDGIFEGVGSVISFIPIIVTMFFFLSILEDSGYIARVAFFMDKLLRKIGLSGRSIVPMLIGFGCTVPAVMSTRSLPSERDRKMTILLTPFMSCTAKLPVYAFLVNAFFPKQGGLIMTGLYILGIITGIIIAFVYRKTLFKGEAVPFVMELPNYRMPKAINVTQLLWEKAKDFLQRAFTVIFVTTVIVWFLQNFDIQFNMVENSKDSILAMVSGLFAPLLRPLGLGDWRICTSLISGFMAKESVVATMNVLFGNSLNTIITPLAAASLLVFSLLYTPCVAAVASIKRELGSLWAFSSVLWYCIVAWIAAMITRIIGMTIFNLI